MQVHSIMVFISLPKQHSQMGPSCAQLGPNLAQPGPNWGPYGMLLGYCMRSAQHWQLVIIYHEPECLQNFNWYSNAQNRPDYKREVKVNLYEV